MCGPSERVGQTRDEVKSPFQLRFAGTALDRGTLIDALVPARQEIHVATAILTLLLLVAIGAIAALRRKILSLESSLEAREKERRATYDFLDRLGTSLTGGGEATATMEIVVEFAQEAAHADAACLFVLGHEPNAAPILRARVVRGLFPPLHGAGNAKLMARRKFVEELVLKTAIPVGEGPIGIVARRGQPMLIPNARAEESLREAVESGIEFRDLMVVPLVARGEVLGVLALANKTTGGAFNEEDMQLSVAIADQAAVTLDLVRLYRMMAERQRLEQELELARTFQALLLPRTTPSYPNVEFASFYRPALEVGGDYFDFIPIDDHRIGIVVGDVSGKGIPGALVMASVRACLRAEARISDSPKRVLQRVNDEAARDTKEGVFITMTYGILNVETGRFRFCRAGHEPILCCQMMGEAVVQYLPEGIALGLIEGEHFGITAEQEIDLSAERNIVLYTDGVVEAMNGGREEYGEARFHQVIRDQAGNPPARMVESVMANIEDFTRGLPQHDDITLVVIGWKAPRDPGASRVAAVAAPAATA